MDNNGESSDYESVYESSDTGYDSDSSVSHVFSSESETDFDDSSYDIASNLVTRAPDLGKLTQTQTVINQLTSFTYFIYCIYGT